MTDLHDLSVDLVARAIFDVDHAGWTERERDSTWSAALRLDREHNGSPWHTRARAVLALIGGRTEAEVKADQIDHLIDRFYAGDKNHFVLPYSVLDWLRSQPEYQARYGSAAAIRGEGS